MTYLNRRNFLKTAGAGMGIAIGSGMVFSQFLSGCNPKDTNAPGGGLVFGLAEEEIKKLLEIALSKGGEFSELYFEHTVTNSVTMAEDIIKESSESIALGVGVRVINGQQQGYGYTNDINFASIKEAALTAASIAGSTGNKVIANLERQDLKHRVYDLNRPLSEMKLSPKIDLIKEAYEAAQRFDSRIKKVTASMLDSLEKVTIANSEGLLISDVRPQTRLFVQATAVDEKTGVTTSAFSSEGGRAGAGVYSSVKTPAQIGTDAANEAIILLSAKDSPAGEMPVILDKNQSGVMIHESVGHPLEADANWKGQSNMSGRMGEMVASPIVTIYDDATIPNLRGSLNIDDEGTITKNVMLIENGKLTGYLNDRLSAKIMNVEPNGHGRRQSYQYIPIPRMNNTVLAKGDSDPEEILKSVKKGFYAVSYQGGMVNNTGTFTFSVNLGYMVEDGKLTYPLKNATLIGSNLKIMQDVDMIGNDTGFFLGSCGKEGQTVPVTCGTPTLRIAKMTVGGKA